VICACFMLISLTVIRRAPPRISPSCKPKPATACNKYKPRLPGFRWRQAKRRCGTAGERPLRFLASLPCWALTLPLQNGLDHALPLLRAAKLNPARPSCPNPR
jgi:hypothetical protein